MSNVKQLVENTIRQWIDEPHLQEAAADGYVISRLRDMVNKKTESRLIKAGDGKMKMFTLDQASKIVSLYDHQRPDEKKDFESELNREAGLKSILKMINKYKLVVSNIEEATDYKVMHKSFTDAVNAAKEKAEKAGYTIDDDEWFRKVSTGPKKPGSDKTNRYTIELMAKKAPAKKALHFQVYNTGGAYELNAYIN
jgi:hypothetical protein